jgi:IS5 family transposase
VYSNKVTDTAVHDSQVFEALMDQAVNENDKKYAVYADTDSAYRSLAQEEKLATNNITSQICEKGARNHPLTFDPKASNKEKSKVRARIKHVFGAQAQMGEHMVRTIGLLRAEVKLDMMNLVYNMGALGAIAQARQERCACCGIKRQKRREKEQ